MHAVLFKSLFQEAWQIYKAHFLSFTVIYSFLLVVLFVSRELFATLASTWSNYALLFWFLNFAVQAYASLAILYLALKASRDQFPSWREFSSKSNNYLNYALALLIFSFSFYFLLKLNLFIAFVFFVLFLLSLFYVADNGDSFYKGFLFSLKLSSRYFVFLSLLFAIVFLMNLLSSFLYLIPLAFTVPFGNILIARVYACLYNEYKGNLCKLQQRKLNILDFSIFTILILMILGYSLYLNFAKYKHVPASGTAQSSPQLQKAALAFDVYKNIKGKYPAKIEDLAQLELLDFDYSNLSFDAEKGLLCDKSEKICKKLNP